MSKIYSHSKLSAFEQCPLKFKFRYIDKIPRPLETTIEAHLGSSVHSALEWLYTRVKEGIIPTIDDVIVKYNEIWQQEQKDNLKIINGLLKHEDYFNKGIEFLVSYYMQNKPFDDNTIEIEKKIVIEIGDQGHKLQGYIDRLAYNLKSKEYEVHDYKTANTLPSKEKIDTDRQLALYSIGIKEIYGQTKRVKLVWHFLAHNKRIEVKKTDKELQETKDHIQRLITKIENTTEFPAKTSRLCDWCDYKTICPAWGNTPPEPKPQKKNHHKSSSTSLKEKYPTLSKYMKE